MTSQKNQNYALYYYSCILYNTCNFFYIYILKYTRKLIWYRIIKQQINTVNQRIIPVIEVVQRIVNHHTTLAIEIVQRIVNHHTTLAIEIVQGIVNHHTTLAIEIVQGIVNHHTTLAIDVAVIINPIKQEIYSHF